MASPQTGIFALGTSSHAYLEFDLAAEADAPSAVASPMKTPRIGGFDYRSLETDRNGVPAA